MPAASAKSGKVERGGVLSGHSTRHGPRRGGGRITPEHPVETPFAAAGHPEVEKREAIDDRQLTAVKQRKEAARRMCHEVRDRDIASEDERDGAGEQAERKQKAADQLDQALRAGIESNQIKHLVRLLVREIEYL